MKKYLAPKYILAIVLLIAISPFVFFYLVTRISPSTHLHVQALESTSAVVTYQCLNVNADDYYIVLHNKKILAETGKLNEMVATYKQELQQMPLMLMINKGASAAQVAEAISALSAQQIKRYQVFSNQ
jgi:hypothetical protein